ncbi:MAG: fasciclin domain-containing protein [Xanthomonadaceae bacterium]|nr:fasciclin domain-containing protein [Silanimonas sp.]MBS3924606.1 fasciclin domain-containing protein [Xanthomonadaceae bacterium]
MAFPLAAHYQGGSKAAKPAASANQAATVVDIATGNPDFSTLVAALKAAGLVDTLKGAGPFTVFAPTNAAFAKLPPGTLDNLLKPENRAQLTAILTYHVVPGRVLAADAARLTTATTVNGATAAIVASGGRVTIDGATITATDIKAGNGVVHVIDTVMLP